MNDSEGKIVKGTWTTNTDPKEKKISWKQWRQQLNAPSLFLPRSRSADASIWLHMKEIFNKIILPTYPFFKWHVTRSRTTFVGLIDNEFVSSLTSRYRLWNWSTFPPKFGLKPKPVFSESRPTYCNTALLNEGQICMHFFPVSSKVYSQARQNNARGHSQYGTGSTRISSRDKDNLSTERIKK
jgi:hypothetical protein